MVPPGLISGLVRVSLPACALAEEKATTAMTADRRTFCMKLCSRVCEVCAYQNRLTAELVPFVLVARWRSARFAQRASVRVRRGCLSGRHDRNDLEIDD